MYMYVCTGNFVQPVCLPSKIAAMTISGTSTIEVWEKVFKRRFHTTLSVTQNTRASLLC